MLWPQSETQHILLSYTVRGGGRDSHVLAVQYRHLNILRPQSETHHKTVNRVHTKVKKIFENIPQGPYSNKKIQFQHIPGWIELNLQDISDAVYQTSIAINMLEVF